MDDRYNFYNLEAPFKSYLFAGNTKVASVTAKNYLSDLRHFLGWFIFALRASPEYEQIVDKKDFSVLINNFLNKKKVDLYKEYLASNNIPVKTINRRLSSLRKFCSFCISQGWLKENPAKHVKNVVIQPYPELDSGSLIEFKKALGQAISDDVRGFLNFIKDMR